MKFLIKYIAIFILFAPILIINKAVANTYENIEEIFLADDQIIYEATISDLEPKLEPLQTIYNDSELNYNTVNDEYNTLLTESESLSTSINSEESAYESLVTSINQLSSELDDLNSSQQLLEEDLENYIQIFSVLGPEDAEYADYEERIQQAELDINSLSLSIDQVGEALSESNLEADAILLSINNLLSSQEILNEDIAVAETSLIAALESLNLAADELKALVTEINLAESILSTETTEVQNQLRSLDEEQLDALNRSLKNIYAKKDRILLISSDDLSQIIDNGYNKKQINDLVKAYEVEQKFLSKGNNLLTKAVEKDNDKFLELAQKAFDNADKQKSKFLEKIDKEEAKKEKKLAKAQKKADKKAADAKKKADKKAADAKKKADKKAADAKKKADKKQNKD